MPLGHRPDGSILTIPIVAIHGGEPGPTLAITAGIHGDEYEGPEGLRRFLNGVDPRRLRGNILAVLQANPLAFERFNRIGDVDFLDLNRSFPGSDRGFLTQKVASILVDEVVAHADFLVDLHGGGLAYDLVPYVGFNSTRTELGERSFALAQSFGIDFLYGSTPFPNVMRLEAAQRGIPAILVEVGGNGRLNLELVPLVEQGLHNVARHIGLLDGPVRAPTCFHVLKAPKTGEFLQAPTGGFLVSRVYLGDRVQEGEVLGSLCDPFGNLLADIRSEQNGIVISLRTIPVTRIGDWTYAVLLEVGEIDAGSSLESLNRLDTWQ